MAPRTCPEVRPEDAAPSPEIGGGRDLARAYKENSGVGRPEQRPEPEASAPEDGASASLRPTSGQTSSLRRAERKAANRAAWAAANAAASGDSAVRDAIWAGRTRAQEAAARQAALAAPAPDFFAARRRHLRARIAERRAELLAPGHIPYRTQKERALAMAERELANLPEPTHG